MIFIQRRFNKFPIRRQIQIGVSGVSLCVCILVFLLLLINCFILLNISFTDTITLLDMQENENIDEILNYLDEAAGVRIDITKLAIQRIRNFIEINKKNQNFLKQITIPQDKLESMVLKGDITRNSTLVNELCPNPRMCLVYQAFNPSAVTDEYTSFFLKIAAISIPLLNKTMETRFQNLQSLPIFEKILMFFNDTQTIVYYPVSEYNPSYTEQLFHEKIAQTTQVSKNHYFDLLENDQNSSSIAETDISKVITNNPELVLSQRSREVYPYLMENTTAPVIISTTSARFVDGNFLDNPEIIDVISAQWSSSILEVALQDEIKDFKGIMALIASRDRILITQSACQYLVTLYDLQNNLAHNDVSGNFSDIESCFKYPQALSKFRYFFNKTSFNFKRKAKFQFFNEYQNTTTNTSSLDLAYYNPNRDRSWKISFLKTPDVGTKFIINSNFLPNFHYLIVVMKNLNYSYTYYNKILSYFHSVFIFVAFYNLAIWYVNLFIILLISIKVTDQILDPINKIISYVSCFNSESMCQKITRAEVMKITFPYDSDINDMFKLCKNILLGGFREVEGDQLKMKLKSTNYFSAMNRAYNNIAFIKSNNLLIKEDENILDGSTKIFNYTEGSYDVREERTDESKDKRSGFSKMVYKVAKPKKGKPELSEKDEFEANIAMLIKKERAHGSNARSDMNKIFMKATNGGNDITMIQLHIKK